MKVWITKYALTQGIYEIDARRCDNVVSNDMIESIKNTGSYYHGEGRDWHLSKEDAIKKAEEMRQKKIANLENQIEKLRGLKF